MKILGMDLGNAKTKLCLIEFKETLLNSRIFWKSMTLPFTKDRQSDFEKGIPINIELFLLSQGLLPKNLDCVVVCCSHSYSYDELHQSIIHLASILSSYFKNCPCFLISANGQLTPLDIISTLEKRLLYAYTLTNFVGSAYLGSKLIDNGLSLDIGTTTTDIIPISNGKMESQYSTIASEEYLKFRYQNQRINWLGLTMTPLTLLTNNITLNDVSYQIVPRGYSSDLIFSLLDLVPTDLMNHHAYFSHFPNREESFKKLAQFIGMDPYLITIDEAKQMANHLYQLLIDAVSKRVVEVTQENFGKDFSQLKVAVFALGESALAKPALLQAGFNEHQFVYLNFRREDNLWSASSVFAMALKGLEWILKDELDIPGIKK